MPEAEEMPTPGGPSSVVFSNIPDQRDGVDRLVELGRKASEPTLFTLADLAERLADPGMPPNVVFGWDRDEQKPIALNAVIEPFRTRPKRKQGTARVRTLNSFIDLVNRHRTPNSAIFGTLHWSTPVFTAIIDYHEVGETRLADWGQHRIEFAFPMTDEWKAWTNGNGKFVTQDVFAAFLEDRIAELATAAGDELGLEAKFAAAFGTPADILGLSRGLSVTINSKVMRRPNLQNGVSEIIYTEEHQNAAGEKLVVPGLFLIEFPVFEGGTPVRIPCRLRYRVAGEKIHWAYQMWRHDVFIALALQADKARVIADTGLPFYEGAVEG